MTEPSFRPVSLPDERAALIELLTGDEWPFHVLVRPTPERAAAAIDEGLYGGPTADGEAQAFWIELDGQPAGLVTLRELGDPTPVFDLRVRSPFRRRGLGRAALRWLAGHVFSTTDKHRLEGHTRVDNVPMRRTFRACGWVKEAHYRRAWPDADGGAREQARAGLADDAESRSGDGKSPGEAGERMRTTHHTDGVWHDAIAYAVLKDDLARGAVTPVPFDHEP